MYTVLFDLDGTLLPMDEKKFVVTYFKELMDSFKGSEFEGKISTDNIYNGMEAMMKNDGSLSNEEVFWNVFQKETSIKKHEIEEQFMHFYKNGFQKIKEVVGVNKHMVHAVNVLKDKGYRIIAATNPMFPSIASESRLAWSGVDTDAFEHITTYEDFHHCKPNTKYFEEVLEKYNVDPEKCIMVGNDSLEDGAIRPLGVPLYLIKDCLIHRGDDKIEATWLGEASEFSELVETFEDRNK